MTLPEIECAEPDRLTLAAIFKLLAGGRLTIFILTLLFVGAAICVNAVAVKQYRTYYLVMPAPANNDALRATVSPLSILSQTKSPDWDMYQSLLTSWTVADRIVRHTNLLQKIFADRWDAANYRWKPAMSFDELPVSSKVNALFGQRASGIPNALSLQAYLIRYLSIQPMAESSMVVVRIDSPSPEISAQLLNLLHTSANDIVREARLERGVGQRKHLLDELNTTSVSDYRAMLQQILSRVESDIMTASVPGQYAGVMVDGVTTQGDAVFPRPFLFLELAVVGGVIIGLILVVFTPLSDTVLLGFLSGLGRRLRAPFA